MSDLEEPPTKVSKYEQLGAEFMEGDSMEEGQEEWLSEGVLTDDDYHPAQTSEALTDSNTNAADLSTIPEETNNSVDSQETNDSTNETNNVTEKNDSNIEQTLDTLDNTNSFDISKELDAFLIKKTVNLEEKKEKDKESEIDESVKQSDDDGNDTDELLRLLGDEKEEKKAQKPETKETETFKGNVTDSDDEFLQVKKDAGKARGKQAPKAVPEDYTDTSDMSSDDDETMRKMFDVKSSSSTIILVPRDSTAAKAHINDKLVSSTPNKHEIKRQITKQSDSKTTAKPTKTIVQIPTKKSSQNVTKPVNSTQVVKVVNSSPQVTKIHFTKIDQGAKTGQINRPSQVNKAGHVNKIGQVNKTGQVNKIDQVNRIVQINKACQINKIGQVNKAGQVNKVGQNNKSHIDKFDRLKSSQNEDSIDDQVDDEFDEDDDMESLEEDWDREVESDEYEITQTLKMRKPEQMDEEMPSDDESLSDEDSLYDDFQSSSEDENNDWFSIDIRGERAGDYLPILGRNAKKILLEEKTRVDSRLASLKQNISALKESGKQQAMRLQRANTMLMELDMELSAA